MVTMSETMVIGELRHIVKVHHKDDCFAMANDDSIAHAYPLCYVPSYLERHRDQSSEFYGDSLGRKNGQSVHWQRWICMDPSCPAETLVSEVDIQTLVNEAIRGT